jgi:cytosine deaminase
LRPGSPADLVVLDARNWTDLLARSPQRRVMRDGVWLPKPEREEPAALLGGVGGLERLTGGDWSPLPPRPR